MTSDLKIKKLNHATLQIESSMDVALELSEAFKFMVDGYKFMPAYKNGTFDGYIRLFNLGSRTIASGLFDKVVEFADKRDYTHEVVDDSTKTGFSPPGYQTPDIDHDSIHEYMENLDLHARGVPIEIRDYQIKGVLVCLRDRQAIIKSSVGSGKSMILYCVCRYLTEVLNVRVLVIVPTIGLTTQLRGDFRDYSSSSDWSADDNMHLISGGADHTVRKPIVVSTFQSLAKSEGKWLNDFGAIITDEGHSITAKSFQNIYGKATHVPFRLACTGTLHDTKCNMLTMQGLTGPVVSIAETKDLIAAKQLVPLKVKSISLNYPEDICKAFTKTTYEEELKYLVYNPKRNQFICKLAVKTTGTTLVFFRFVEHGKMLCEQITEMVGGARKVYFIDGGVSAADRESIRHLANDEDCIVVASYGTMKAGVNLPAIENIIIGHPIKGGITFLQSIGRGLRLKKGKTFCNLFDIGDNLVHKKNVNHTYRHFGSRIEALTREGYDFNIVNLAFN